MYLYLYIQWRLKAGVGIGCVRLYAQWFYSPFRSSFVSEVNILGYPSNVLWSVSSVAISQIKKGVIFSRNCICVSLFHWRSVWTYISSKVPFTVYSQRSCLVGEDHSPTQVTLGESTFHTFRYKNGQNVFMRNKKLAWLRRVTRLACEPFSIA